MAFTMHKIKLYHHDTKIEKLIYHRCFYELKGMAVYQKCCYQGTDILDDVGEAIRKGTTAL